MSQELLGIREKTVFHLRRLTDEFRILLKEGEKNTGLYEMECWDFEDVFLEGTVDIVQIPAHVRRYDVSIVPGSAVAWIEGTNTISLELDVTIGQCRFSFTAGGKKMNDGISIYEQHLSHGIMEGFLSPEAPWTD